jgi:glycosyltransferase involved in cell wall biosynthesis
LGAVKKLLIITDWFAPGYKAGGPIQSCVNICAALNANYNIYVLTTDTDHGDTKPYPDIEPGKWLNDAAGNIKIFYLEKKTLTAKKIAEQIAFVNADIVYLNHLFSPYFVVYPLWLTHKGFIKSKVVVCPRGALYDSALSLKSYKKKPLLLLYKWLGIHKKIIFHATNEREQKVIEKYFVGSRIIVANNLPNTKQNTFASIEKQQGKLNCIFIARIVPIKNLLFLLNILKDCTSQIKLTVVGPVENESYWQECKNTITSLPSNIIVDYIGPKQHSELSVLIQQHHLFILPTTGENFGHSIFEALLAGRPVLISDQTPWLLLKEEKAGWDLSLNNPAAFKTVIEEVASFSQLQYDEYAKGAWQYAADYINKKISKEQYYSLFA